MAKRTLLMSVGVPLVGFLSLGIGAILVAQNQPQRTEESPTIMPPVAPVSGTSRAFIGAVGITEATEENVSLGVNRSGIVTEVLVRAGDRVVAGQPLLRQDARAAEAAVAVRRQELEAANLQLAEVLAEIPATTARRDRANAQLSASRAEIQAAESGILRFEAALADSRNQSRIGQSLIGGSAISAEEADTRKYTMQQAEANVDNAKASVLIASAGLESAKADLAEAEAILATLVGTDGSDGPRVRSRRTAIAQANAALDAALVELAYLTTTAPIAGTILQVNVRPGEYVQSGSTVAPFIVGTLDPLHVRVQIDEVDIPRLREGAEAHGFTRGAAETRLPLRFIRVEPLVIPKRNLSGNTSERVDTRILEIIYSLDAGVQGLYPGQQLDVYITLDDKPSAP